MTYKILSLDGGGTWAVIQVKVLQNIYGDIRGREVLRNFELVISNSGGSLVLACLIYDMRLSEIISIFTNSEKRRQIFSSLTILEKLVRLNIISLFTKLGPRYETRRKLKGIKKVFEPYDLSYQNGENEFCLGEYYLHELPELMGISIKIIIAGYDYSKERATFFRSDLKSNTDKFGKNLSISLFEAIHASSNAPINYFDAPAKANVFFNALDKRQKLYWDGAVAGFNNPVLAGLIEAITNNYKGIYDYSILSLGTGTGGKAILTDFEHAGDPEIREIYSKNLGNPLVITGNKINFGADMRKMSVSILGDPPDSASFIAYSILDPSLENIAALVRINPCLAPVIDSQGMYVLPEAYLKDINGLNKFLRLLKLDMDAIEDEEVNLILDMCDKYLEDGLFNQLIRGDIKDEIYLGQKTFKEAKLRWKSANT